MRVQFFREKMAVVQPDRISLRERPFGDFGDAAADTFEVFICILSKRLHDYSGLIPLLIE